MKKIFPENYTVLLYGPPGVGKSDYVLDLIEYYLKYGEKVIYITSRKSPDEIIDYAKKRNLDIRQYENKTLFFIDCYSWSVGKINDKRLSIDHPASLNKISICVGKAANTLGTPVRIFFDTLSTLFLHSPPDVVLKFTQSIAARTKSEYGFILLTMQKGMHNQEQVTTVYSIMDGVIELDFEEKTLEKRLRIHHLDGFPFEPEWIPFKVTPHGVEMNSEVLQRVIRYDITKAEQSERFIKKVENFLSDIFAQAMVEHLIKSYPTKLGITRDTITEDYAKKITKMIREDVIKFTGNDPGNLEKILLDDFIKRKKVLVVEDNEDFRIAIKEILKLNKYEVVTAVNGVDAIESAKREHPDLILMDIGLPVLNGYEATRRLKSMEETKDILIVALTSFVLKGDDEKALAAGCDGYIPKPIDMSEFPKRVQQFFEQAKYETLRKF
ncbi:MAG: response regulator [Promethearchaeota archaeon]